MHLYRRRDLNPHGHFCPLDFKSNVSTNSTTSAFRLKRTSRSYNRPVVERKTGFEPATSTLARWHSTNWAIFAKKIWTCFNTKADANLKLFRQLKSFFKIYFLDRTEAFRCNIRLISFSFIKASTGVRVSISISRISSRNSSSNGSSSLKKLSWTSSLDACRISSVSSSEPVSYTHLTLPTIYSV